ncbi:MAG: CehA/McbA family metallohydrolase [Rubripirellula sp.]
MMTHLSTFLSFLPLLFLANCQLHAQEIGARTLQNELLHLRLAGPAEWTSFDSEPDGESLNLSFAATKNNGDGYLRLRHQDVKQTWQIKLNDQPIGTLRLDENDMVEYFLLPPGVLVDGDNQLTISQETSRKRVIDDIRVGEIAIGPQSPDEVLRQATVKIEVSDSQGEPTPARITVTNEAGALQSVGADSTNELSKHALAIRPGVVYTSTGHASFGLPPGNYTVTVGRGFEYSISTCKLELEAGESADKQLTITRQVATSGYVACDTHVHTRTHSGHGDANVYERMVTLAGEGVELPVATDHNVQIDHRPFAYAMKVSEHFTPVIGNEVTTKVGHFNVWPIRRNATAPNHKLNEWAEITDSIFATPGIRVAILNHARDLHGGTTPFGSKMHLAIAGANLDGWPIRFNAMELINSGATQTDIMQLTHDWMSMLNAGYSITPVGCSDSHDVARYSVGQGRTYIRCDDRTPGEIDITAAADAFLAGQVMVSYGLLCEMIVDQKYQSGSTAAPAGDTVDVAIRVLGPEWTTANDLVLYANGTPIRSWDLAANSPGKRAGVHAEIQWSMPMPVHDVHLVAVATGPGIAGLHWPTAKPYQPDSPDWTSKTYGCSGAIWIDADKNGRRESAADYAREIIQKSSGDLEQCLSELESKDVAVAVHVARSLQSQGLDLFDESVDNALSESAEQVRNGFEAYRQGWRESKEANAAD